MGARFSRMLEHWKPFLDRAKQLDLTRVVNAVSEIHAEVDFYDFRARAGKVRSCVGGEGNRYGTSSD